MVLSLAATPMGDSDSARADESDESLPAGLSFLMANCMQCHEGDGPETPNHNFALFFRKQYGESDWSATVERMHQIALEEGYSSEGDWTDEGKKELVAFLAEQTAAKGPREGARLFQDNCLRCHRSDQNPDFPDHTLGWVFRRPYTRAAWADNVERMQAIALDREFLSKPWTDEEKQAMVEYLTDQTRPQRGDLETLGQLHFASVHFPIALVLVLGVLEVAGIALGRPVRRDVIYVLWWFSLAATAVAVVFGFFLVWNLPTLSENLAGHRNAGLAAAAALIAGLIFRELAASGARWARWASALCLLIAAAAVGAAGHLGGKLIHGEYFQAIVETWM